MIRATLAAALVVIAIGCGKSTPPPANEENTQQEQKAREHLENGQRVPPKRN